MILCFKYEERKRHDSFIKEWWECGDKVRLITRPRRFGKTLNLSMIEFFFQISIVLEINKNIKLY